jgi:hypothetical protein
MAKQTKKAQKEAEDAAYCLRVQSALKKAHDAATQAGESFIASAAKSSDGQVRDASGGASVIIRKPSHRFRKTLESLGEISSGDGGAWLVSHFTKNVNSQSAQANEKAAKAACDILEREFPEEPPFYVHSYLS